MKLVRHLRDDVPLELGSFIACLATVLELDPARLPPVPPGEDGPSGGTLTRWLGGLGIGLVAVADPGGFTWPGPWLGRTAAPPGAPDAAVAHGAAAGERRYVVMYGVPSGVIWDPAGEGDLDRSAIEAGFVLAASDIALARPPLPDAPDTVGQVEAIWLSPSAGVPAVSVATARALPGRGLDGDRHTVGAGTFPSGSPGSALTLIAAEVCDSFDPPLGPDDHRRNVVTRGIDLNRLVGHEFTIGAVRCRGARLCEPCTVVQRYADRPILRALVHRGGLRADILSAGEVTVGAPVTAAASGP